MVASLGITAAGVGSFLSNSQKAAGLIGGIRGLFGSGASARAIRDQAAYQKALQIQAQQYNTWMMRHRYQLQREDLEKAGINPLYGLGSAPSPVSGTGSVGMPDYVGEKNGRTQNAIALLGVAQDWSAKQAQIKNVEQQTKTEEQNTLLKTYEALTKEQEKIEKELNNKYLDEKNRLELEKLRQEIKESKSRITYNLSMASAASSSIELNRAQAGSARASKAKLEAETAGIQANNNITIPKNEAYGRFLKKHPGFAGTVKGAQDMLGVLTAIGAGGVAIYTKGKAGSARKKTKQYAKGTKIKDVKLEEF